MIKPDDKKQPERKYHKAPDDYLQDIINQHEQNGRVLVERKDGTTSFERKEICYQGQNGAWKRKLDFCLEQLGSNQVTQLMKEYHGVESVAEMTTLERAIKYEHMLDIIFTAAQIKNGRD